MKAEALFRRALMIREKRLGPEHPRTAQSLHELAKLYTAQGQYEQAEPLLMQTLAVREKTLGPAHPDVATTLEEYAGLLSATKREQEGAVLARRAKQLRSQHAQEALVDRVEAPQATHEESNHLQVFFATCCELHSKAWGRADVLWKAYQQWANTYGERFPLSHRAFTNHLKAAGCQADRTKTGCIWRGIALLDQRNTSRE